MVVYLIAPSFVCLDFLQWWQFSNVHFVLSTILSKDHFCADSQQRAHCCSEESIVRDLCRTFLYCQKRRTTQSVFAGKKMEGGRVKIARNARNFFTYPSHLSLQNRTVLFQRSYPTREKNVAISRLFAAKSWTTSRSEGWIPRVDIILFSTKSDILLFHLQTYYLKVTVPKIILFWHIDLYKVQWKQCHSIGKLFSF